MIHKKNRVKGVWTARFLISSWAEPASEEALSMCGCGEQDALLAHSHQGHDKNELALEHCTKDSADRYSGPASLFFNQNILEMFQFTFPPPSQGLSESFSSL